MLNIDCRSTACPSNQIRARLPLSGPQGSKKVLRVCKSMITNTLELVNQLLSLSFERLRRRIQRLSLTAELGALGHNHVWVSGR
jgi:hypothetical protein